MKRGCSQEKPCDHNCPCDCLVHPQPLRIRAGLTTIPRQIAGFPEFRRAMLADIRMKTALFDWRARGQDDLGLMLLEMWAYVLDVQAFYDQAIANEAYLRTVIQRPSLRRLVGLLGYVPRPAVAAAVSLGVLGEGRQPVILPAGLAFRSAAFDGNPPQVFELDKKTTIHPLNNKFTLAHPRPTTIGLANPNSLTLELGTARLEAGSPVLLSSPGKQAAVVKKVDPETAGDGETYTRVEFSAPLTLAANTLLASLTLQTPSQQADLWSLSATPAAVATSGGKSHLTLDAIYKQIKAQDYILVERNGQYRWFQVKKVAEVMRPSTSASTMKINGNSYSMPGLKVPVTRLTLDKTINDSSRKGGGSNWTNNHRRELVVHYDLQDGGTVTAAAKSTLSATDTLKTVARPEEPAGGWSLTRLLLEDRNQRGLAVGGSLNYASGAVTLDQGTSWSPPLANAVQLYGNVVNATRGETVESEILGSGDASQANQRFELKKGPLTYLPAPTAGNDSGVASTLKVWVEGILWKEVSAFYGAAADAQIYIVRQDDEEKSSVIFGDGVRGARLPSGSDNVVASYRHGAGKASPPAGSISQLAKPVKGLTSARNPVAASGGADRESEDGLRKYAPASALILGRAVSMADMEAVAAGVAGVRAVAAEWRWNGVRQRPVAQIWYVGEAGIKKNVAQRLRGLTDPTTPIDVITAVGIPATLSIDIEIDERYLKAEVLADVREALMDEESGILAPERIGIGRPLYRSQILSEVVAVEGVVTVIDLAWNGAPFPSFAVTPGAGKYFDLESGDLLLDGKGGSDG